ncbi:MAG: hypothetical protein HFH84_08180 [Lachnospiraceae bacterium]|nr:hypothetical protein [Lachnospiraceae bacterium]
MEEKMEEIYFSMIVYVDDGNLLEKALKSILDVTARVKGKIKLIIADPIASGETKRICSDAADGLNKNQYVYLALEDASVGEAYNRASRHTEGRYVNFSRASTYFEPKTLDLVYAFAEEQGRPKLLALAPWTVNEKEEYVQYKMSPAAGKGEFTEISLHDTPEKLHLMFHAYFIRCYLIRSEEHKMQFRPELLEEAPLELLCNLLAEHMNYTYLQHISFHYTRQLEDNTSAFMEQHYKWWYMDSFRNWILPLAQAWEERNYPLRNSMRILLLYLVFARYNCNMNDRNKGVVEREEIPELRMLTGKILQYVDSRIIFAKASLQNFNIPRAMKLMFIEIKAEQTNCICEPVVYGGQMLLWTHKKYGNITERAIGKADIGAETDPQAVQAAGKELDITGKSFTITRAENSVPVLKWSREEETLIPLCELQKEHVILSAVNYSKNSLKIDGLLSLGNFISREDIRLYLYKDGKEYSIVSPIDVYDLKKVFGITYARDYRFYVEVPVFALGNTSELQFMVEINGTRIPIEIRSGEVYAHVNEKIKGQYWHFDEKWCLSIVRKNVLKLEKVTAGEIRKKEETFQKLLAEIRKPAAEKALEIRRKYFAVSEEYQGRRIWITFDKLYKAGDNGEYMYDYISAHDPSIEMYYVIKSDSPDYQRMLAKGDRLLIWGAEETLVKALYAEVILDTHASLFGFLGFDSALVLYLQDLFNPLNVCIQHGLTVQNIAQYQNRLKDNMRLYCCASSNEIENLKRPVYGYVNSDCLKLTGLARYDGLINNDQKQILISPSWRRNIASGSKMGTPRQHSESFKESDYFRIYNSLINDKKLVETAKRTKYKIVYLLHPITSSQISDFDRNDYVDILQATDGTSYEKILTESSLMVTDYSGIQFDFAYMRKPILYYHPKDLPSHFEESPYYSYKRDAFGPLIDNQDELVNQLCEYMKNHCRMKQEYVDRADRFYAFSDCNNCERIHKSIVQFVEENN